MWINHAARYGMVSGVAMLPLLLGLPCFCCVPRSRRFIATIGCGWAFIYGFGMTVGPVQSARWMAWFFGEVWLSHAINLWFALAFYGIKAIGLVASRITLILLLTGAGWAGFNIYHWLHKRHRMMAGPGADDKVARVIIRGTQ